MTVHQIHEFYVHLDVSEDKEDEVNKLGLSECWDFEIANGYITVDGFDSENEAQHCENQINKIILKKTEK